MNLSFAGCGFLGIYHVGVASCFREYAPHALIDKIAGCSAGALAASALICGVPLGESTSDVLRVVMKARSRVLGPFHPGFDLAKILYDGLNKMLPADAHILCSGKLHISCTRVCDGQNVLISQFSDREELIQALLCSCFIPFYSGIMPPRFQGTAYMDGGMSDNLPVLDEKTVTVSPFSGESDICPQDNYFNFLQINLKNTSIAISPNNLYRLARILFPPPPEILTKMCQQGFDDALRYLQRNQLISCMRCLAVQSSFTLSDESQVEEDLIEMEIKNIVNEFNALPSVNPKHEYDDCTDCRQRRQMACYDSLPESVVNAIQEACESLNKGVMNWLFKHKYMKILSFLSVPYVLPIDITIVMISRILELLPKLRKEMTSSFFNILAFAKSLLSKFDKGRHLYSAKFSCQLAITEYNYVPKDEVSSLKSQSINPPQPLFSSCTPSKKLSMEDKSLSMEEIRPLSFAQRRSYAGSPSLSSSQLSMRRMSMFEQLEMPLASTAGQPERVLKTVNFGFTMGVGERKHENAACAGKMKTKRQAMMKALESLDRGNKGLDVTNLADKALNWEKEYVQSSQPDFAEMFNGADTFENILEVTNKHDALMAFYYSQDNKHVTVTEIYNVTDADTSAVLAAEERETNNKLEWDEDWNSQDLGFNFGDEQVVTGNVQLQPGHNSRRRKSLENSEYMLRQQPTKVRRFAGQWNASFDSQLSLSSLRSDSFLDDDIGTDFESSNDREDNSHDFSSQLSKNKSQEYMDSHRRNSFAIVE